MYIIQADIRGKNYWLRETGKGFIYEWAGIRENATPMVESEAQNWKTYLIVNHASWTIDIIPYN